MDLRWLLTFNLFFSILLMDPGIARAQQKAKIDPFPPEVEKRFEELEKPLTDGIKADAKAIEERMEKNAPQVDPDRLVSIPPDAMTMQRHGLPNDAYRERVVDEYLKSSLAAKEDQAEMRQFFIECLDAEMDQEGEGISDSAYETGRRLNEARPRDPLVRLFFNRARQIRGEQGEHASFGNTLEVRDSFEAAKDVPPIFLFLAKAWHFHTRWNLSHSGDDFLKVRREAFSSAAEFFVKDHDRLNLESALGFARTALRHQELPLEQQREFYEVCLQRKVVDPWILHVLAGEFYMDVAWFHRGSGYANTVTEEGFRKLDYFMNRAAMHNLRAWHLRPEFPRPAWQLMEISYRAIDTGWTKEQWLMETIRIRCDYPNIYLSYIDSQMPRWGGSHQAMVDFAKQCLATQRWDTKIPTLGIHALWRLQIDVPKDGHLGEMPEAKELADASLETLKPAIVSGKARIDDFLPQLCLVASVHMEAGDFAKAKECFELLGSRGLNHWNPTNGVNYWQAFGLSSALSGPAAQEVADFHAAVFMPQDEVLTIEELDELKGELATLRKTDPHPSSEFYFKEAELTLAQLKAYAAGEWVNLTFDDALHGWIVIAASVKVEDDRTVVLRSSPKRKNATIQPTARFKPPFAVEAEITTGNLLDRQAYAGIMVGSKTWTSRLSPQLISAGPDGAYVDVEQLHKRIKGDLSSSIRAISDRKAENSFVPLSIRHWPGALQFIAWNRVIHSDLNYDLPLNDHLHFGNVQGGGSTRVMKIRNVRIRRLAIDPPREEMSEQEQLEYHRQALKEMPDSVLDINAFCRLLVASEKWDEALGHLTSLKERDVDVKYLNRMLAVCYLNLREYELAVEHFQKETKISQGGYSDRLELAWLLATMEDEAKQKGRKAYDYLQIAKSGASFRKDNEFRIALTTAAVDMQRDKPELALKAVEEAISLAKTDNEKKLAQDVMDAVKSGKPYRLPVKSK